MTMRICKRIRPIVRPNSCPDCVGMVNTTVATGDTTLAGVNQVNMTGGAG